MAGPGLVVPVRLEVLCIGARDAENDDCFLPPYADFSTLPGPSSTKEPYLSSLALSQPFTGNAPLQQGIYLHWNLPKALRRGVYDQQGNLAVPPAPNRWLVTRVLVSSASPQPEVTLTNWVVESDYLSATPEYSQTTVPQNPVGITTGNTFAYLGRVYTLDDWLANGGQGTYLAGLTAMGFGVPDFSSYYPNCRNVFGLSDASLNEGYDPSTTSLGYVVTGWYADPAQDPLHDRPIDGARNDLGWLFGGGGTPTYSLFTGAVWAVEWNPPSAFFPDYQAPLIPDVALGNTPEEALAALVASRPGEAGLQNVEEILNALQLGALQSLDRPDGLAALDAAAFNAGFGSSTGGTVWDVRPVPGAGGPPPGGSAQAYAGVGPQVALELEELNGLQRQIDVFSRRATSLQGQIFADWQKFMTVLYAQDPGQYPSVNDIYSLVNAEITALDGIVGTKGSIAMLQGEADALQASIAAALPATVQLTSTAAPRFYQANDPVILLSGDGVPGSPPDNADTVQCVLTDALVTAIQLPAGVVEGSAQTTLDGSALPTVPGGLPYPVIAAVVQQSALLNPATPSTLAAAIAQAGGNGNPAVIDFTATSQAIGAAQTAFLGGTPAANGITFTGTPPQVDVALKTWATPWNPIALSWRFDWRAPKALDDAGGAYDATFVTDNFTWDAGAQSWRLTERAFSSTLQAYQGTVLLSPDASISLRSQIRQYLDYYPDGTDSGELTEIESGVGSLKVLAQTLGGLDQAMLMLEPTLQLPVADPAATSQIYYNFSNTTVPAAVGAETVSSPVAWNTYSPLRAGRAVLDQVILIDEFGRYRNVNVQGLVVSSTIPNDGQQPPALFPPLRLAQPARLDFRWLSAANPHEQSTSVPESSPICGWVVPNHLDDSLMFYDADGASIGSLTPAGDAPPAWQSAPGSGPATQTMDQALSRANAVLAAFARSVVRNGPAYLSALVRTCDETQTLIGPGGYTQDSSTAVLIGTPLALVQASVGLSLRGLPSPDQGWAALQADAGNPNVFDRTTHGFPGVQFPVWLGNLATLSDGVVGFFTTASGGGVGFDTFWAAKADGSNAHIAVPTGQTLTVTADPAAPPQVVTLLVDPRASVHAMTGITPIKALDIPSGVYARALAAMTFTFLTSPVLALPGGVAFPVPAEGDGTWTWVQYAQDAWDETAVAPVNLKATLQTPAKVAEGWLKLTPKP